jgi:FkbM family methyltransferase
MKNGIKQALRHLGFELRRYSIQTSAGAQLDRLVAYLGIDLVLDVGSNIGQYAHELRSHGYRGRIVSFEPSEAAHADLTRAARGDDGWSVAPRMALGSTSGEATLHVAGNSLSSSVLRMLPEHERAAPGSKVVRTERVPLHRLDEVAVPYLAQSKAALLKIDTQGYEAQVLAGSEGILDRVLAIQLELSLVPLYEGQPLFDAMRERLNGLGFALFALFPGYVHEVTGSTLQIDGFFVRKDHLGRPQ